MNIKSIKKEKYNGPVYNMELESSSDVDDLFWVEYNTGIVSHNCFPKDVNALLAYANDIGVDVSIMEKAWELNMKMRTNLDWAEIEGAVSNE